jgi:MFS family permease
MVASSNDIRPSQMSVDRQRVLVATLCAVQFVDVLGTTIVIVALPNIEKSLNLSDGAREQAVAAYALLFGSLLLLAGRLADAWGAKRLFIAGLICFGCGSVVGGLAPVGAVLIAGRAMQGTGAALAIPAALAMIAELFAPGPHRNRVLGYWAAMGAVGGAAGFALGGMITDILSWRWTLLVNLVPIALAVIVMANISVPKSVRRKVKIPLTSSLNLTLGLLFLIFGLTNGQTDGLALMKVLMPVVIGVSLLCAFARGERGSDALLPAHVWKDRSLMSGSLVGFSLTFTTTAGAVLLALYLQQIKGISASATGWLFVPASLAVIVGSSVSSRLVSKMGLPRPMIGGLIFVGVAQAVLALAMGLGWIALIVGGLVMTGFGLGVATVASTALGLSNIDSGSEGAASGMLNAAARVGTAIGIAVYGTIAVAGTLFATSGSTEAVIRGYQIAHILGSAAIGITSVCLYRASSSLGRTSPSRAEPVLGITNQH